MKKLHNLLKRQIKQYFGSMGNMPDDYMDFLNAVNEAYRQSDDDRIMLERSMELSSDELIQANSEIRAIFQAFPDLFFRLDSNGLILDVKAGDTKDFYIEQEKLLGKRIQDVSENEIKTKFTHAITEINETRSIVSIEYSMTIEGNEHYYEARLMPLMEDQIFVIIRNITNRKKAEIALKESEEKYRLVLEASPDPIVVYDMERNCEYMNPAFTETFGWSKEDLLNKKINYIPKESWPITRKLIKKISAGEGFTNYKTKRYTVNGNVIDIVMSAAVWRDADHNPVGSVITLRDITENKRLEDQLFQAHKMKAIGILAGGVAHDFNNLLTGMQGNITLMLLEINSDHPFYENLKNLDQYIKRGADLTKQMLGFARGGKYEVIATNINKLIDKCTEMFGRTKKEINIYTAYQDDIWNVEIDPGQIEQVLINLFVNAWQAMPDGGDLIIKTENVKLDNDTIKIPVEEFKISKFVKISVTDTGTGMDEEIQNNIFDPFFTTKEIGRGTGLGLSSAYGIIKNHDGFIRFNSIKGRGTTFIIYLPASIKEVTEETMLKDEVKKGNETIMLIDDEEMILEVAEKILKKLEYNIIIALSGADGVKKYKKEYKNIQLIILDMIMPDMSGRETYEELKKINPDVNVLLSSGYSIDGEASSILKLGCNGFIQKPYNIINLSQKIREILDSN